MTDPVSITQQWALLYASWGWSVFPAWSIMSDRSCQCGDALCTHQGKHPMGSLAPNGVKNATSDSRQIQTWWEWQPFANVCVATGEVSGIVVVDIDPRNGGVGSLEEYEQNVGEMPLTLSTRTGGGGRHLFYRYPTGVVVPKRGNLLPGIDIQSNGCYVIAPPSPHVSGLYYEWEDSGVSIAEMTPELVGMIVNAKGGPGGMGGSGSGRAESLPSLAAIRRDGIPDGERDVTLHDVGAREMYQGRVPAGGVLAFLTDLNLEACRPPLSDSDVRRIASSLERWWDTEGRHQRMPGWESLLAWVDRHGRGEVMGGGDSAGDAVPAALEWNPGEPLPLTDVGNAHRLVNRWGDSLRWSKGAGWWVWDGQRWMIDDLQRHRELAQAVSGLVAIEREALDLDDGGQAQAIAYERWVKQSHNTPKISALLKEAEQMRAVRDDVWDADPWLLNLQNGVLDLRTLEIRPHRREDLLTKVAATYWEEGATAPVWAAFMERIMPDPNIRWFIQKAVGYSLTGVVDAKCFFVLHGSSGDNGKSTFLKVLKEVMLGDYQATIDHNVVIKSRSTDHSTVVADMAGARFVTLNHEIAPTARLNIEQVKTMTGGDEMSARRMHRDMFTFRPQMKLWIGTNHRPALTSFDRATRQRLRLVPFEQIITGSEKIEMDQIMSVYRSEAPGILAWAIEGLRGYLLEADPLAPPTVIEDAVDDWMRSDDPVRLFIDERCELCDPADGVTLEVFYQAYTSWAEATKEQVIAKRSLLRDLDGRENLPKLKRKGRAGTLYGVLFKPVGAYGV